MMLKPWRTGWKLDSCPDLIDMISAAYVANGHHEGIRPIWGVKKCYCCGTMWNRDTNAARNIAICFYYSLYHNGLRPPWFLQPKAT